MTTNFTLTCSNLSVASRTWPIYETTYQFNGSLTRDQRNNLLRWLYTNISAPVNSVLNLRSESANTSGGSWPSRPYYNYNSQTSDSSNTQTVYVLTEDNAVTTGGSGANSTYVNNLYTLFSGANNSLNSSVLSTLSSAVGVNVTSANIIGFQNYMVQRNDTSRTVTASSGRATYNNNNVTITNVTMAGGNGIIYYGVAPTNSIVSSESLLNCLDTTNNTLLSCARVAVRSGQNSTLVLSNITTSSTFQLFSTYSNAYLLRPIVINPSTTLSATPITLGNNFVTTSPTSVTIAPGACQSINVTIGTWPYSNVTINGISSNSNVTISNAIVVVNGEPQVSTVQVCAAKGSSITNSSTITWSFNGTNSADYLSNVTNVNIVNASGDISIPTAVTVPRGGCSNSFLVNASSLASQDVYIQAGNNSNYFFSNSTNGNFLHFNQSGVSSYNTSICSYENATGGVIPIIIGGTNSNLFTVNGGNQSTITSSQTDPPSPSIYFQTNPVKYNDGTNATISVISNR